MIGYLSDENNNGEEVAFKMEKGIQRNSNHFFSLKYKGDQKAYKNDENRPFMFATLEQSGSNFFTFDFFVKDGVWKAYDYHVSGISIANHQQSDFRDILVKDSPERLLEKLQKEINKQNYEAHLKKTSVTKTPKKVPLLKPDSFDARELNYETELTALFLGDFNNARLKPDSVIVSAIYKNYLEAYGKHCDACLPGNKVPITVSKCAKERITRDIWGNESSSCIEWVEVPTGLFADPRLYNSSNRLSYDAGIGMAFKGIGSDAFSVRGDIDDAVSLGNDMDQLVRQNGCQSAALKRFERNLYRFVEKQPPLRLPGKETLASIHEKVKINLDSDHLNLAKLLDDLITENSKGWSLSRYNRGTISRIKVQAKNEDGSPRSVHASYRFTSLGKPYSGNVRLTFYDGIPQCLYFYDAPRTCRHPSPRIVRDYEKGRYLK
ncbi:hypothetical protein DSCO28_02250 [Desulfosarcina ovata subsp. sediminis]|uniref:Uncharacterized protein n=1 Tax=Desulfosarcina ovata subsp. sediminis TaxID=885957 RepID=A0A5K7ZIU4_9BACT|nr:ABC transporter substrate-binding protein [Desulfosarcina ovata]BBO79659.1 hypothetical protein DSCO28_02250 [Desulfosarcina ovata subsp. sediminis]